MNIIIKVIELNQSKYLWTPINAWFYFLYFFLSYFGWIEKILRTFNSFFIFCFYNFIYKLVFIFEILYSLNPVVVFIIIYFDSSVTFFIIIFISCILKNSILFSSIVKYLYTKNRVNLNIFQALKISCEVK